jgi:hypothetical protein
MSIVTQIQLVAPQQLAATDAAAWYVAPTQTTAKIGRAVFCNTSASATTITAGISTGGALAAGTTLISARAIAPGETYVSPELAGQVLPAGSAIRAYAANASDVTFAVSGLTIV